VVRNLALFNGGVTNLLIAYAVHLAARTAGAIFTNWSVITTNPILKPQAAEVVKKHGEISLGALSDPEQPVLARRGAVRSLEYRNADAPAAGQDHDPLFQRS
jgi:hypothetical protein